MSTTPGPWLRVLKPLSRLRRAVDRAMHTSVDVLMDPASWGKHFERNIAGYGAAVLGVATASLCIAIVQRFIHVSNISLVYLFVVIWLAIRFGRWPAVVRLCSPF